MEGVVFRSERLGIPPRDLHEIRLRPVSDPGVLRAEDGGITFLRRGWYEILLTVEWDGEHTDGSRFAHTAIPDQHPLHSEAINAAVLAALSGGRQLLRGNTIFVPGEVDHVSLEVWHDARRPVVVRDAVLEVRDLASRA